MDRVRDAIIQTTAFALTVYWSPAIFECVMVGSLGGKPFLHFLKARSLPHELVHQEVEHPVGLGDLSPVRHPSAESGIHEQLPVLFLPRVFPDDHGAFAEQMDLPCPDRTVYLLLDDSFQKRGHDFHASVLVEEEPGGQHLGVFESALEDLLHLFPRIRIVLPERHDLLHFLESQTSISSPLLKNNDESWLSKFYHCILLDNV